MGQADIIQVLIDSGRLMDIKEIADELDTDFKKLYCKLNKMIKYKEVMRIEVREWRGKKPLGRRKIRLYRACA